MREISLNFMGVSENLNLKIAHFENKVPINNFEQNLQGKLFNSLTDRLGGKEAWHPMHFS